MTSWMASTMDGAGMMYGNGMMSGNGMMGNGMMPGPMMGDVDNMVAACEQWMSSTPAPGATSSSAWCRQMAEWMQERAN
ncbi:MAG TPA: hypothetical protein VFX21_02155 [Acidimicrobiia bacterium]|nr:hypothetical protein [Acidimicrobiia bacterium]